MRASHIIVLLFFWYLCPCSWANNVQLTNAHMIDPLHIGVSISWENTWRLEQIPANHDAVWVFLKYRETTEEWKHVALSSTEQSHFAASPLEIKTVDDGMGVFVRLADTGALDLSPTLLELELATPLPMGTVDVTIYGIEMVYISEDGFFLGDSSSFHHFRDPISGSPYWIDSEESIGIEELSVGDEASIFGELPADYPKGFGAFYTMKYEISQAQYRDFLNSLAYGQQDARTTQPPSAGSGSVAMATNAGMTHRNGLVIETSGQSPNLAASYACEASVDGQYNNSDDGQNRACNFLNWQDLLAYLDWAALRPMTELEFEKSCRGPKPWIAGEYAWGTDQIIDANSIQLDGTDEENVAEMASMMAGLGSHGYVGPAGPLRCGFGGTETSNRLQIGASYYGALELSGNLWELCVTVDSSGLLFDGLDGDGMLGENGSANTANWPLEDGAIHRGGAWFSGIIEPFRDLAVSDRFYHELQPSLRRNTTGGRGVRSVNF